MNCCRILENAPSALTITSKDCLAGPEGLKVYVLGPEGLKVHSRKPQAHVYYMNFSMFEKSLIIVQW